MWKEPQRIVAGDRVTHRGGENGRRIERGGGLDRTAEPRIRPEQYLLRRYDSCQRLQRHRIGDLRRIIVEAPQRQQRAAVRLFEVEVGGLSLRHDARRDLRLSGAEKALDQERHGSATVREDESNIWVAINSAVEDQASNRPRR